MKMFQEKKLWKPICVGMAVMLIATLTSVSWAQTSPLIQTGSLSYRE